MKDLIVILGVIVLLLLFLAFGRVPPSSTTSRPSKRDATDSDAKPRD